MNDRHDRRPGVGGSFDAWTSRIYPPRLLVSNSTPYLRVLRSHMLRVLGRIDDELKRRDGASNERRS